MLQLRWPEQWQQAILVSAPFAALFVFICCAYFLTKARSIGSAALRLIGAVVVFTVIWIVADALLPWYAWTGVIDRPDDGLTLRFIDGVLQQLQMPGWLEQWIRLLPLPLALLFVGVLVTTARRTLARSRFAIERHRNAYLGLIAGISGIILLVLLWPQPDRNPEMQSVPIPADARSVTYTHTPDDHHWPMTTFALGVGTVTAILTYYQEILAESGWQLEYSEPQQDPLYGTGTGKALLTFKGDVLELTVAASTLSSNVETVKHQASPGELASLAALPKPTPTPTLEPPPPPAQTAVPLVPTQEAPISIGPMPTTQGSSAIH